MLLRLAHLFIWHTTMAHHQGARQSWSIAQKQSALQAVQQIGLKRASKTLNIGHDCLANFDQTPLYFSPESMITLDRHGSSTVAARGVVSTERATALIGVSGVGHKFPPFLIFKGSRGRTGRISREFQRVYNWQNEMSMDRL